jgi:hypothetical protein
MYLTRSAATLILVAVLTACAASTSPRPPGVEPPSTAIWAKEATGGLLMASKGSVVDPGCANQTLDYEAKVLQVDDSGETPGMVITKSGSTCLGKTGQRSEFWVKSGGRWVMQFSVGEGDIRTLAPKNLGVSDVSVFGGNCAPVWRWQGARYEITRRCP